MTKSGRKTAGYAGLPALATATAATTTTTAAATAVTTTAAAAATAAAAVATTAAATATAAEAATAATTTTAAILSLFHGHLTTLHVATIQLFDGLASFVIRRHLNEAKPTRAAGLTVGDDLGVRDRAQGGEQIAQIQLRDAVRQISHVKSGSHFFLCVSDRRSCRLQNPSDFPVTASLPAATEGPARKTNRDEGVDLKSSTIVESGFNFFFGRPASAAA